jgi:hypothetical protein
MLFARSTASLAAVAVAGLRAAIAAFTAALATSHASAAALTRTSMLVVSPCPLSVLPFVDAPFSAKSRLSRLRGDRPLPPLDPLEDPLNPARDGEC